MLEIRNLSARVGLSDLSLSLHAGARLVLLGPTGSGKSTLLRLIIGLESPLRGDVILNGRCLNEVPPHERGIAFVPQRVALYPHLSVKRNLEVNSRDSRAVTMAADLLKIPHLLNRMPNSLSGGEKQRVALARAVVKKSRLWLLDEPFAPLDPLFRNEFRHELHLLLESSQATMILVSHDPIDALALGRLVGVLGDGRLQQLGTREELQACPGNPFVEAVVGQFAFGTNNTTQ